MLLLKVKIQPWSQGEAIPLEVFALRHLRARKYFSRDTHAAATHRPEEKDHHLKNKAAAILKIDLNQHYTIWNGNPPALWDCKVLEDVRMPIPLQLTVREEKSSFPLKAPVATALVFQQVFILPGRRTRHTQGGAGKGCQHKASAVARKDKQRMKTPKHT